MTARTCLSLAAALALAAPARAQQPPPVRQLTAVTALSRESLASVAAAVEVGTGRVYVNDITGRRVLFYDSALAAATVIADSDGTQGESYGERPATLLHFRGDSALLITPGSLSMLVLGPDGRVARVMAMPPSGSGMPALIGFIFGTPGFDAQGRLVYFSPARMEFRGRPGEGPISLQPPDSALVVRFDFATRTLDTVGTIRIPRSRSSVTRGEDGRPHITMTALPPAVVDDWAVTSDGRVAIVRGRDYHVEWLGADGAWTATGRLPFAWEHLDDAGKTALLDSVAAALQVQMDSLPARMGRGGGPMMATREARRGADGGPGAGGPGEVRIVIAGPGGAPGGERPVGPGPAGGSTTTTVSMPVPTVVKADLADVPDYRPAFGQGAVRADLDGNLWVRTTKVADGRPVYDVVNGRGDLVDRVQLPQYRTIAGFGRGVVYLGVQDSSGVTHVERVRVR